MQTPMRANMPHTLPCNSEHISIETAIQYRLVLIIFRTSAFLRYDWKKDRGLEICLFCVVRCAFTRSKNRCRIKKKKQKRMADANGSEVWFTKLLHVLNLCVTRQALLCIEGAPCTCSSCKYAVCGYRSCL